MLVIGVVTSSRPQNIVQASDNNFSDGITVDSTGDGADTNLADSICDDGSGNCTLRAAIQESNNEAGTQTIEFNITGTADFTNGGQDGYAIEPNSALPAITDTVTIDGYSQPGSQANTAVAPAPLDGVLLIEIDGSNAGVSTRGLLLEADAIVAKGLVVNSFTADGIDVAADNIVIQGCYIGISPTGLLDKGNDDFGIAQSADDSDGLLFGGLDPEDRNIVSGNSEGGLSPNTNSDNWIIQGNYFGVDATGLAALPNSISGGSGALSIDNNDGHIIGGPQTGAANVISGNASMGIAPHDATNHTIQGNYIGVDYTGNVALPNGGTGIAVSGNGTGIIGGSSIGEGNIIANSEVGSIGCGISLTDTVQMTIIGNSIFNNYSLGICHGGPSVNDPLDSDNGPNNLLNFPIYDYYSETSGDTEVFYRLDVPAGDYRIEFFSNTTPDPSSFGEGELYLGHQDVTHLGGGEISLTHVLSGVIGVTNLAMTATERNVPTLSGFGATSEFGGQAPPNTDLAITKELLNPEDVAQGATIQYAITITNEGRTPADLSSFSNVGLGAPLFTDYAPPELSNAQPYLADGPFPGSSIIDVSNPDLTCLWVEAGVGMSSPTSPYANYGILLCWYTGIDTDLLPGDTITATFTLDLSNNSDLVFNNYAIVSTLSDDPDNDPMNQEQTDVYGGSTPDFVIESTTGYNNIAVSRYPTPVDPGENEIGNSNNSQVQNSGGLVKTGQDTNTLILLGTLLISSGLAATVIMNRKSYRLIRK